MAQYGSTKLLRLLRQLLLPTPMTRVGMFFLAEDAPQVVSVLARLATCHVERIPSELEDYLEPCFPPQFREAYRQLRQYFDPLAQRWRITGCGSLDASLPRVPTIDEMNRTAGRLETLTTRVEAITQQTRRLQQRQLELEHFDEYVRVLSELEIDVNALTDLRFLHVRAGTVPAENVDRLRESAELSGDLVLSLGVRGDRAHVLVVGVGGVSSDLEGLLGKAHFEPHPWPSFELAAGSQGIVQQLKCETTAIAAEFARLTASERALYDEHRELLLYAATEVSRAAVFAECEGTLEGRAPVSFLSGWVVADRLDDLRATLASDVLNPVAVVAQPAVEHEMQTEAPSEVSVPRLFQPGLELVTLYGQPGYGELNPTLVLAATTPMLFGMMFGDVGHGLLLLLATLALRRWLRAWVAVGVSCGLGAMVFGVLYGSVFGVEHWLPAIWLRPMDEPFRLLETALWMGVGFVLLAFVLKVANLLHQREWLAAALGFQGLAGAAFYFGGVHLVRSFYAGGRLSPFATGLCLAGLLLIGVYTGLEILQHGRAGLADLASEHFHTLLSLLTNTLSFLRLAAFALAHAALSLATFLVMETLPPTPAGWLGRAAVFVIGTAIILVLDGLAVGIQVVRLQFYEGLARYYRGDGRVFRPLRFKT